MKTKILKTLLIFVISLGILIAFMWLRGGSITVLGLTGFPLSMLVYAAAYFGITVYFLNKYKTILPVWLVLLVILVGTSFMDIYARFIRPEGFQRSLASLPDFIIRILAVFIGLLYYKISTRTGKIITAVCSLLFFLWSSCYGFDLWLHKVNYGSTSGSTQAEFITNPLILQKSDGTKIQLSDLQHNYTVLDFWSTTCGVCFSKFPAVQSLFNTYKDNSQFGVYGVHYLYENNGENIETGAQILSLENYTFPSFSINGADPVLKEIGIDRFPTVLIINKQGQIVFRGNIEKATKLLRTLDILEKPKEVSPH